MRTERIGVMVVAAALFLCASAGASGPGTLKFSEPSFAVAEEAGSATIVIERSQGEDGAVSVQYSAAAASATNADFTAVAGTLAWPDGDGTDRTFQVPITDDASAEGAETIRLTISSPTGGAVLDGTRAAVDLVVLASDGSGGGGGGGGGGGCESESPEDLSPGAPRGSLAVATGCPGLIFFAQVPRGATFLDIATSGGSGNADVYVKFGSVPTPSAFDFSSASPTTVESIHIATPAVGDWYVLVQPNTGFTGVSILANYDADDDPIEDGGSRSGIADDSAQEFTYFEIVVPPGAVNLDIQTTGGTGDADLFVRPVFLPTLTSPSTFKSVSAGNREGVGIPEPQGGIWKIGLFARSVYQGVTLVVQITPGGACVPSADTLCLLGGRFAVDVTWSYQQNGGAAGVGHALERTDETGEFWFFNETNIEVVLKILDGRAVNGKFWFFYGSLSDVDYTMHVTDTETAEQRSYRHLPGNLNGFADTSAFPLPLP